MVGYGRWRKNTKNIMAILSSVILSLWFPASGQKIYDISGSVGSLNHLSIGKGLRINRFLSVTYPVYDFAWDSDIYGSGSPADLSYNGLLTAPSAIYEVYSARNGQYKNSKWWIIPLALTSVPVMIGNLKLRFGYFDWIYVESGLETEFFKRKAKNGINLTATVGASTTIKRLLLGVHLNRTILNDGKSQSLLTGKVGFTY